LRHLREWRVFRVIAVGGVGFAIQTTLFELLSIQSALLSPSTAAVLGGECAIISNFLFNERFSFWDRVPRASSLLSRLTTFHAVSLGSLLVQWSLLLTAEQFTAEPMLLRLVYLTGIALGFLVNYSGYYFFVWRGGSAEA
jgi:dolichol-phosphate mannosyltransferase